MNTNAHRTLIQQGRKELKILTS